MEESERELRDLFNSASNNESKTKEIILAILLRFYLLGSGYESEADFNSDDREFLDDMYAINNDAVKGIIDRWDTGIDMEPTIDRILHHVLGAYHFASMSNRDDVDTLSSWVYGVTVDHCIDCVRFVEMGPMPVSYWQEQAKQGFYPQSPNLECVGLHCDCRFKDEN